MPQQRTDKYRVEIIFRFNQDDTLPDSIKDVHRVASTSYFEILAGTITESDFAQAYGYLMATLKEQNLVSFYFESVREGESDATSNQT